jgi:Mn2+/Fe2+ NRAMP family transporter
MTDRRIAALMAFVAATLVVMSVLHLSGAVGEESPPFHPDRAGIAEAVIAVVLAAGAFALVRGRRLAALAAVVFAIAGFGVGLSMTVRDGGAADIAYHAAVLPLLVLALAGLSGASRRGRASRRTA